MGYYLQRYLGDDYCAIAATSTDNHTAEMEIDVTQHVGFKVVGKPLEKPNAGSFNAFLEDNNLTNTITLTDLKSDLPIEFSSIRSQSAFVKKAFGSNSRELHEFARIFSDNSCNLWQKNKKT